jgi:hypothetical protein
MYDALGFRAAEVQISWTHFTFYNAIVDCVNAVSAGVRVRPGVSTTCSSWVTDTAMSSARSLMRGKDSRMPRPHHNVRHASNVE